MLLNSATLLNQVNIAVVEHIDDHVQPELMQNSGNNNYHYIMPFFTPNMYLQLSASIKKSVFYTVAPLVFTQNEAASVN